MKQEYWINVKHVDNRLVIFLNGEIVWDSGIIHGDPVMDHFIEITGNLAAHPEHASELIFEGFNDSYNENGNGSDWRFCLPEGKLLPCSRVTAIVFFSGPIWTP